MAINQQIIMVAVTAGLGGFTLSLLQSYLTGLSLSNAPTSRSRRLSIVYAFLSSYRDLSPGSLLKHLASNFTHQVLPASLESPIRNKDAFSAHAGMITSIFKTFEMIPMVVYEDPHSNAIIVHAQMVGELNGLGPWKNECIMLLRMSHDGKKIVEMKEFVDSARAALLKEKLMSKMGKQEGNNVMNS